MRAAAIGALARCVCSVTTVRRSDMHLFTEYILPNFYEFRLDCDVEFVRLAYATHATALAECAFRFLNVAQFEGSEETSCYDRELLVLRNSMERHFADILNDTSVDVKIALLHTNIGRLCPVLGHQLTIDLLLCHILTYFNDKRR